MNERKDIFTHSFTATQIVTNKPTLIHSIDVQTNNIFPYYKVVSPLSPKIEGYYRLDTSWYPYIIYVKDDGRWRIEWLEDYVFWKLYRHINIEDYDFWQTNNYPITSEFLYLAQEPTGTFASEINYDTFKLIDGFSLNDIIRLSLLVSDRTKFNIAFKQPIYCGKGLYLYMDSTYINCLIKYRVINK